MGCFLGCFGGPKQSRRSKPIKRIPSRDQRLPEHYRLLQQDSFPTQQQQRSSPLRLQLLPAEEVRPGSHLESRDTSEQWVAPPKQLPEEKPPTPVLESRDKVEKPTSINPRKRVTFDLNVKTYEQEPVQDESGDVIEEQEHSDEEKSQREGTPCPRSSEAFPSNHRYQNCTISDGGNSEEDGEDEYSDDYYEEEDDDDCEDCALDDDDEEDVMRGINEEEESFESYFSLPTEREKRSHKESGSEKPVEAGHAAARDRSRYVHSVLNPVENLSQWKEAKAKKAQPQNIKLLKKENIGVGQEPQLAFNSHPSLELPKSQKALGSTPNLNTQRKDEVLMDASLSTWLPSSEIISPVKDCCRTDSKVSLHDRTIAGAVSSWGAQ